MVLKRTDEVLRRQLACRFPVDPVRHCHCRRVRTSPNAILSRSKTSTSRPCSGSRGARSWGDAPAPWTHDWLEWSTKEVKGRFPSVYGRNMTFPSDFRWWWGRCVRSGPSHRVDRFWRSTGVHHRDGGERKARSWRHSRSWDPSTTTFSKKSRYSSPQGRLRGSAFDSRASERTRWHRPGPCRLSSPST